ncbi:MAG: DUF4340 domain-containing protein [candidate division Zixibacteria bacterium]|nr:DUF4340 domain-containing protein [candidate division Zixibacteria bacterium]
MKSKNIVILAIIFAVLIVLYIIQNVSTNRMAVTESTVSIVEGLNSEDIGEIRVYRPGKINSGLHLVKSDNDWHVKSRYNAPAKVNETDKLIGELSNLRGEVRGKNQELVSDFGLADSEAVILDITGNTGEPLSTLLLGKQGPDYRGCFIKKKDSPMIYFTSNDLTGSFGLSTDDSEPDSKKWVELKMIEFAKEELQKIKIIARNKSIELLNQIPPATGQVPDPSQAPIKEWVKGNISGGVDLEDTKVNTLVSRVVNFRATDVANPDSAEYYGFDKSRYKAEITDPAGDVYSLLIGNKLKEDEKKYYARILGKNIIYVIAESGFNNLFKTPFEKKKN